MITISDLEDVRHELLNQLSIIEVQMNLVRDMVAGEVEREQVLTGIIRIQEYIKELESKITQATNELHSKRRGPLDFGKSKGTIEVEE